MEAYAVIAFYVCIIVYAVFVVTRLTTSRPETGDPNARGFVELALLLHAGLVVVGVVIPLIVFAVRGGFSGQSIGQILLALPRMAFDEDSFGFPARLVSYSFVLAGIIGLYQFARWVHYRRTGIKD